LKQQNYINSKIPTQEVKRAAKEDTSRKGSANSKQNLRYKQLQALTEKQPLQNNTTKKTADKEQKQKHRQQGAETPKAQKQSPKN